MGSFCGESRPRMPVRTGASSFCVGKRRDRGFLGENHVPNQRSVRADRHFSPEMVSRKRPMGRDCISGNAAAPASGAGRSVILRLAGRDAAVPRPSSPVRTRGARTTNGRPGPFCVEGGGARRPPRVQSRPMAPTPDGPMAPRGRCVPQAKGVGPAPSRRVATDTSTTSRSSCWVWTPSLA